MVIRILHFWNRLRNLCFLTKNKNFKLERGVILKNTKVICKGKQNRVYLKKHVSLNNCTFNIHGNHNDIVIDENVRLEGVTLWMEEDNNRIIIGTRTSIEKDTQLAVCEGTVLEIGVDCMFSHSILVRTTDSHSIVNAEEKRINSAANIHIGNHVWVGLQSLILKGTDIPDNCVVGARSIVSSSKNFEQNSVIVGSPAKCVRKNINWLRDRI